MLCMNPSPLPKPVKLLWLVVTQPEPQALPLTIRGRLEGLSGAHYSDWIHNIYMHQDGLNLH